MSAVLATFGCSDESSRRRADAGPITTGGGADANEAGVGPVGDADPETGPPGTGGAPGVVGAVCPTPTGWMKLMGGTRIDTGTAVLVTKDGHIISGGDTSSTDGDLQGRQGVNTDAWLVKLDQAGNVIWKKTYGGTKAEKVNDIVEDIDGNYVVAASTQSSDGDLANAGFAGNEDAWLFKVNAADGAIMFSKCLGGVGVDAARVVRVVQSEATITYEMLGETRGSGGNITRKNHGSLEDVLLGRYVVAKPGAPAVDLAVNPYVECWGGGGGEVGIGFAGVDTFFASTNGDPTGDLSGTISLGSSDAWVFGSSNVRFGGSSVDNVEAAIPSGWFAGTTQSSDGKGCKKAGTSGDIWIGSTSGDKTACFGSTTDDKAWSLVMAPNNQLLVIGESGGVDGDLAALPGRGASLVLRFTTDLAFVKGERIGLGEDYLKDIAVGPDFYVAVGRARSGTGEFCGAHGQNDMWIVKRSL